MFSVRYELFLFASLAALPTQILKIKCKHSNFSSSSPPVTYPNKYTPPLHLFSHLSILYLPLSYRKHNTIERSIVAIKIFQAVNVHIMFSCFMYMESCLCNYVSVNYMTINSWRIKGIVYVHKLSTAHPDGCTVWSMGSRLLACWDCGFEIRAGATGLSLVRLCVLSGRFLCDASIIRPEQS